MKLITADGKDVLIDLGHLTQHESVLPLLEDVLGSIKTDGKGFIKTEIDMGRVIGVTDCVETTQWDDIVYAKRKGRPGLTRFTKSQKQKPCNHVTVVIKRVGESYKLLTGFIGRLAEREPWDRSIRGYDDYAKSKQFWDSHALVWGTQEVED